MLSFKYKSVTRLFILLDFSEPACEIIKGVGRSMEKKTLEVRNPIALTNILSIFAVLDDIRWSITANYNLINYCATDFTPDEKLLTHWLCYITDRQTVFERVWAVGGYVLSHLVREFTRESKSAEHAFLDHIRLPESNQDLRFEAPFLAPNDRLGHYDIHHGPVVFASRYMPADAVSVLRTLLILEKTSEKRFTRFIYTIVHGETDQRVAILKLAAALYFLTYADIGQVSADDLQDRLQDIIPAVIAQAVQFAGNPKSYTLRLSETFNTFGKKRLWCSIRDYLKSPVFNEHLVKAMMEIDPTESLRWERANPSLRTAMDVIELPGDVWNNNRIFRDGLFTPHLGPIPRTWDMPRTVRAVHDALQTQSKTFYPEQLDVTFDFVPRMCDNRMCHICLFGAGIENLCHKKDSLYCPVTLSACGYVHLCEPATCRLKDDSVRGICKNAKSMV